MVQIKIDFDKEMGKIKPMHAVNNGPKQPVRMFSKSGNFEDFKALDIPYVRNHDAAFYANYGGEHTVDINAIFPNFDADPYDPASYDFVCTDHYCKTIMDAGSQVFYRLGNKIDHRVKKYDSVPPKDFNKWAVICEHIIKHYNEGWADGFHWNITYWEIGSEPENRPECWDGPFEDFLVLFEITAKHLKEKFPYIKVGGPAFATKGAAGLTEIFLTYMKERNVPLNFFSWHLYRSETKIYKEFIYKIRELLDTCGYPDAENILDEWTYMINWHEGCRESKKIIISTKGAAFFSAVMAVGQHSPLDMLMYYDAAIGSTLNGLFYFYTEEKLKGYYPYMMFSKLYKLGSHVASETDCDDIYAVVAKNDTQSAMMITYFTNDAEAKSKKIELLLDNCPAKAYNLFLLDDEHDADNIGTLETTTNRVCFNVEPNTVVLLESTE